VIVARHLVEMGSVEVSGETLQVISAQRPEQSAVVHVSWSHADLRTETLLMYLENQKRSGGGRVKDLQFSAEQRKACVTFVDVECKLNCEPVSTMLFLLLQNNLVIHTCR